MNITHPELADRINMAAKHGRPCVVSPEEMSWLRRSFAFGTPRGEANYAMWVCSSPLFEVAHAAVEVKLVVRWSW